MEQYGNAPESKDLPTEGGEPGYYRVSVQLNMLLSCNWGLSLFLVLYFAPLLILYCHYNVHLEGSSGTYFPTMDLLLLQLLLQWECYKQKVILYETKTNSYLASVV